MTPRRLHKNHKPGAPAWMVTFADMMALLLTFFIILSSISTADEEKYKSVSESMEKAFGIEGDKKSQGPIAQTHQVTAGRRNNTTVVHESNQTEIVKPPAEETLPENKTGNENPSQKKLNVIRMNTVTKLLAKEIQQGTVQVEIKNSSVIMRFPERVAFSSGSDELNESFDPAIENLVKVLNKLPGAVTISGHTDNRPIDTFRFRSNWELSSARAISVLLALLKKSSLNPKRFTVQGHADTLPLKDNESAKNRAENRRVEISIQVPAKLQVDNNTDANIKFIPAEKPETSASIHSKTGNAQLSKSN